MLGTLESKCSLHDSIEVYDSDESDDESLCTSAKLVVHRLRLYNETAPAKQPVSPTADSKDKKSNKAAGTTTPATQTKKQKQKQKQRESVAALHGHPGTVSQARAPEPELRLEREPEPEPEPKAELQPDFDRLPNTAAEDSAIHAVRLISTFRSIYVALCLHGCLST